MSVPELDDEVIDELRNSGADAHVTLLLGAGASVTSGLPDWNDFAARLLLFSGAVSTLETARLFVDRQDPLLVAEAARAAVPHDQWTHLLSRALYGTDLEVGPSSLHRAAAALMILVGRERIRISTLNFDTLLELAIETESHGAEIASKTDFSFQENGHDVHHLHGVITPESSQAVILTLSDFTALVAADAPWQLDYVRDALELGTLLIAGTSYRDPDLRQWLTRALPDRPAGHEALVLLAREGYGLTKEQFDEGKSALASQWSSVGMRAVLLHDYADAAQVIRELPYINASDYLAPRERAKCLWDAHNADFDERQRHYSDLLFAQSEEAKSVLSADRVNLTLWLADGAGSLQRWATHDRYFRSPSTLRKVAIGHDSPWLAGQSLGRDSLLAQDVTETSGGRGQWNSVFAIPIPVDRTGGPPFSTAAITLGAPDPLDAYEPAAWQPLLLDLADDWGTRLSEI